MKKTGSQTASDLVTMERGENIADIILTLEQFLKSVFSNIQITMRYLRVVATSKHAAVERLAGYQKKYCPKLIPNDERQTIISAVSV